MIAAATILNPIGVALVGLAIIFIAWQLAMTTLFKNKKDEAMAKLIADSMKHIAEQKKIIEEMNEMLGDNARMIQDLHTKAVADNLLLVEYENRLLECYKIIKTLGQQAKQAL